jgi:hypothetical protein
VLAELKRIARELWPIAAGVLLGLAIGGMWTLLQPDRYRAETHVILRGGPATRLAPAVSTLANGSVVQENVKQTLRLSNPPDLSARVDKNILVIAAEAGSKERARQVDAEAAQVVTQLVATRFGSEGLQASVLDPAHVTDQTSPTPGRNLFICGLIGLVAGGGLAYLRSRRLEPASVGSAVVDPSVERRLKKRIDEVTKRERALARRAGELAARKAELDRQEAAFAEAAAEPVAAPKAEPEPEPPPQVEAEPMLATPEVTRLDHRWNLRALEALVREAGDGFDTSQQEEWTAYLFFLREHAESDGTLPRSFDSLVDDVFADLLDRRGTTP